MKKIATITASVITAGVLCYLGLSGYIWYYDSQRIKKNDVRLSAVAENNKVLSF
jgi:cytochrome c peroxidase